MKVSLNSIIGLTKRYDCIDDIIPNGRDELIDKVSSQLGAIEQIIDIGQKYEDIIIVKVVSCVDHPNADKLKVCKIDDGNKVSSVERDENGHVQVVCGAPNVREGLSIAWLPPGS